MDRASDYGSEGRQFESLRAHQKTAVAQPRGVFLGRIRERALWVVFFNSLTSVSVAEGSPFSISSRSLSHNTSHFLLGAI